MRRAIRKLKANKSPGEDHIPNEIWKILGRKEVQTLAITLEECRRSNKFPEGWKRTELSWIYKKGDATEIANYRPIALTDTIYKIFMRIMTERLEGVIEREGIISDEQQGFRKDRSCYGAIMALKLKMARCQRERKGLHVAYLDISKAYDTVNHKQLWAVCKIDGDNRSMVGEHKRTVQGDHSRGKNSTRHDRKGDSQKGIRQGCPLSPLLFAMYVEIITRKLKSAYRGEEGPCMLLYADDMVVWGNTKREIEEKLEIVIECMEQLGLQVSEDKTEIQHNKFSHEAKGSTLKVQTSQKTRTFKYVQQSKAVRYLGAWMTADMEEMTGLKKLQEKMKERLGRVEGVRAPAEVKALIVEGKITVSNELHSSNTAPGGDKERDGADIENMGKADIQNINRERKEPQKRYSV